MQKLAAADAKLELKVTEGDLGNEPSGFLAAVAYFPFFILSCMIIDVAVSRHVSSFCQYNRICRRTRTTTNKCPISRRERLQEG